MEKEQIKQELKEIILKSLGLKNDPSTVKGENLIDELHINSVDALEVLIWVENHFHIEIPDEDLSAELISSLDTFSEYVLAKKTEVQKENMHG